MHQQSNIETARALEASERGVERIIPGWTGAAVNFIHEYAQAHASFTTEDIRDAAKDKIPPPPDGRAWGPAVKKAVKLGYIEFTTYATAKDPKVHNNVVKVWRSKFFGKVGNVAVNTGPAKEFKVGDRVRIVESIYSFCVPVGSTGEIVKVDGLFFLVAADGEYSTPTTGVGWAFYSDHLEAIA